MKKIIAILLLSTLLTSVMLAGISGASYATGRENVIVVFKNPVSSEDVKYLETLGGVIKYTYTIINGVAVDLPQAAADKLRNIAGKPAASGGDPVASGISYVEHDGEMYALDSGTGTADAPAAAVQPAVAVQPAASTPVPTMVPAPAPTAAPSLQDQVVKTVTGLPETLLKLPFGDWHAFPVLPLIAE